MKRKSSSQTELVFDSDRLSLKKRYLSLDQQLEAIYPLKNFKNHCYWRIALDTVFQNQWDKVIAKPAYKTMQKDDLRKAVQLLETYGTNESQLMNDHFYSLKFRR